jgi:PAS domain-containing protein
VPGLTVALERADGQPLIIQPPDELALARRHLQPPPPAASDKPFAVTGTDGATDRVAVRPTLYPGLQLVARRAEVDALSDWRALSLWVVGVAALFLGLIGVATRMAQLQWGRLAQARQEAAAAAEVLDRALEAMGDAFLLCGPDDRVVRWNARYLEMFPWQREVLAPGVPFRRLAELGALERFGGYCVEKLYHAVDLEHKRLIMEELAFGIHRLSSTVAGKFLLHSLKVEDFKHRTGEWAQKRATSDKVRREFADILGDEEPQQKQQQELPSQKKSQHPHPQKQSQQQQAPAKQSAQPQHGKHASHSEAAAEARASKKAKHSHAAAAAAPAQGDRNELDDLFDGMSQPPKADKAKSAKKHGGADASDAHAASSKGKKRTLP